LVSDQLLERIAKLIHSPDRRIRLALAQGIGQVDHPDTGDHLAFLIRDQDPEISEVAAAWLEKLDVARARPGIQILLEDGSAWCSRRGFELLEARGAGEGLPILLASLERSAYPALVSDAGRLLKSWGDLVTLDELTRIYRAVDPRRRPLLGQLGRRLAERLGVEDSVFQTKKSPGAGQGAGWFDPIIKTASIKDLLERRRARKEADAMSSAKLELIPVLQPGDAVVSRGSESGYPVGLAGVVACLVAVGVAVMTVDLGPAILVPAGDQTQNRPSTPVKRILRSVLTGTEFETGVSVNSTGMTEEPSGGAGLRDALEPRRITSRSIEIMFDLDEQRGDYRAVVQEARAQLDMGGGLRILLELEYALKSIDRDHVIGRFALGEALVTASRVLDRKDLHEAYSRAIRGGRADMVRALNESAEEGKITRKQADGVLLAIGARAESGESAAPGAEGP